VFKFSFAELILEIAHTIAQFPFYILAKISCSISSHNFGKASSVESLLSPKKRCPPSSHTHHPQVNKIKHMNPPHPPPKTKQNKNYFDKDMILDIVLYRTWMC